MLATLGSVDAVWHLGDVVGYGPDPDGVVARLTADRRGRRPGQPRSRRPPAATRSTGSTRTRGRRWSGPARGSPRRPATGWPRCPSATRSRRSAWSTAAPASRSGSTSCSVPVARANLALLTTPIGLFGHTHLPMVFLEEDGAVEQVVPGDGSTFAARTDGGRSSTRAASASRATAIPTRLPHGHRHRRRARHAGTGSPTTSAAVQAAMRDAGLPDRLVAAAVVRPVTTRVADRGHASCPTPTAARLRYNQSPSARGRRSSGASTRSSRTGHIVRRCAHLIAAARDRRPMIGGRRPLKGRKPADRRVRVERPHSPFFRYAGPGTSSSRSRPPTSPRPAVGRCVGAGPRASRSGGRSRARRRSASGSRRRRRSRSSAPTRSARRPTRRRRSSGSSPRPARRPSPFSVGVSVAIAVLLAVVVDLVPPGVPGLPERRRRLRRREGEPQPDVRADRGGRPADRLRHDGRGLDGVGDRPDRVGRPRARTR